MTEIWGISNVVIHYDSALTEGILDDEPAGPELPVECWNDAPIDLDRAHQATLDLCRGGR